MELLTALVALSPDGLTRHNMLLRSVCAQTLGLEPLPYEDIAATAIGEEPMLIEFAEQFSTDVSAVSVAQRSALAAAFGADVLSVAALLFSPTSCPGPGPVWARSG